MQHAHDPLVVSIGRRSLQLYPFDVPWSIRWTDAPSSRKDLLFGDHGVLQFAEAGAAQL